ncbi:MAG: transcription elongation factor greA [Chloroflexi bacterium]|jgi:transcription elongation factor GreA|nr:transcription elongation factor greA [Chloroflexota bacterium]MDB5074170.1 transcription elongation factor greA [Chloroflexota bacterium]
MNDKPVPLTAEGRAQIEAEYEHLVNVRRAEVAAQIGAAAEDGDLSENAAYDHAKDEQALLEGRIATLEHFLRNAVLIESPTNGVVQLGSKVTIDQDDGEETYTIVGPLEAAPIKGRISNESPMGRALLNHKAGDTVEVNAPSGARKVRIISIQ